VGANFEAFPTLDVLTRKTDLVIVGQVIGQHQTRSITSSTRQPAPFEPAPSAEVSVAKAQQQSTAALPSGETMGEVPGMPVTESTVRVSRVIRGTARVDGEIIVSQLGGKITLPTFPGGPRLNRTLQLEGDSLMVPGQEQVLFLSKNTDHPHKVRSPA
jgi:hypothetical protein